MINVFTIDTEEWFQVFYGNKVISRDDWPTLKSRISDMVSVSLDLLDVYDIQATFFVVGWLAEHNPSLVRRIADSGHEVASHSYWHKEVNQQSQTEFRVDVSRAKACLEDATGKVVNGFRAPGYSITKTEDWALDILADEGYAYDSSLLYYSMAATEVRSGLLEVPPNSLRILGKCLPTNGGFFFRMSPYTFYKYYVQLLNNKGIPLIFYSHTWEILIDYPRIEMPFLKRFIQYTNLGSVKGKIESLLKDYEFTSISDAYDIPSRKRS